MKHELKYQWASSWAGSFKSLAFVYALILLIYTGLRIAFHFLHYASFSSFTSIPELYYWGFRLDFTAIFLVNIPFFLYYFFVPKTKNRRQLAKWCTAFLVILNAPWIAFQFIDLVYFQYHLRRSSLDFFYVFSDSSSVFKTLFSAYWHYILAYLSTILILAVTAFTILANTDFSKPTIRRYAIAISFLVAGGLIARGLSSRPIMPSTPLLYVDKQYLPLVSNSTLNLLYSLWKASSPLRLRNDFTRLELDSLYSITKTYSGRPMTKKNVVLFIMETMPEAYLDAADSLKAYTPFLDSIRSKSIVCKNAFANGLQSNEGIVALLAGLPPFTDGAYFQSRYNSNRFVGIGTLLKKYSYASSFYYGAERDHFGFEKFARILGIERYVSGAEYDQPGDHDGNWGIYDGEFFPFAAERIKHKQSPFFSVVYNLSTHFPYAIPLNAKRDFAALRQNDAQNAVSYYDQALDSFFNSIKHTSWYQETIFIFCADHAAGGLMNRPVNGISAFRIPLFIHLPGSPHFNEVLRPVQQLDIVPTILDLLSYPDTFISFGQSVFDSTEGFVYNKFHGVLQLTSDQHILGFSEELGQLSYLYDHRKDPKLENNLLNTPGSYAISNSLKKRLLAFLQRYNNGMIENKLTVESQN